MRNVAKQIAINLCIRGGQTQSFVACIIRWISRASNYSNMRQKGLIQVGQIYDKAQNPMNGRVYSPKGISPTLRTPTGGGIGSIDISNMKKVIQIANIVTTGNFNNPQRGRIYYHKGISPCLNCCGGGGLQPKFIWIKQKDK